MLIASVYVDDGIGQAGLDLRFADEPIATVECGHDQHEDDKFAHLFAFHGRVDWCLEEPQQKDHMR